MPYDNVNLNDNDNYNGRRRTLQRRCSACLPDGEGSESAAA